MAADLFVVISRPIRPTDRAPENRPYGEADHWHRTVDAAIRCCVPSAHGDRWYDVCRVAGDLRPVVQTLGPALTLERRGTVGGIEWEWTRFERAHPDRAYEQEFTLSRGEWESTWTVSPRKTRYGDDLVIRDHARGFSDDFVRGAAWMLAEVAKRDATSAAALVRALQRPVDVVEPEPESKDEREGVVIAGPWLTPEPPNAH